MAFSDDDPMAGGPSGYYNPEFGLMAIQQPEMLVQHLARNGVQPPADFPDDWDHKDAHGVLGAALKDQSRVPSGDPQQPVQTLPQQGNFEERFSDAFRGAPGSAFANKDSPMPIPANPSEEAPGMNQTLSRPSWFPKVGPTEQDPASRFGRWLRGDGATSETPNPGTPAPGTPLPRPRPESASAEPWGGRPHVEPEPTATSDAPSTTGGAPVAAGTSQERPGNLNIEDPSAKAASSTEEKKEAKAKGDKDESWNSFGKALAGISAMKPPTPVFPHPGNIPHPSNQISRSQYPTELLKELSQIGHPAAGAVRLGALLKGR